MHQGLEDEHRISQTEQQNKKRTLKREATLKDLWNNIKWNNMHITGISAGERERMGQKIYSKK